MNPVTTNEKRLVVTGFSRLEAKTGLKHRMNPVTTNRTPNGCFYVVFLYTTRVTPVSSTEPEHCGMYAYRRMTPEQQKATVEVRRRRGFPLHKPPHPDLGRGWYFITAATFEHRHIFTAPRELTALELRILEAVRDGGLACAGWVVMPNHYHILLEAENTAKVGKVVGPVHGRSSRYANIRDDATGRQVWYKFTDRKIRSERHFWTCLHYIIMNPVKHRFAARAEEWSWSCFHELRATHGAPWIEDLQREYPLREFGRGWDDF